MLGLGFLGTRSLKALSRVEQRAVAIAQAGLGSPSVMVLERPFDGLGTVELDWLRQVLAANDRANGLVVTFAELDPATRPLIIGYDELVLLRRAGVVCQGAPRRVLTPDVYLVVVAQGGETLRDGLLELGLLVDANAVHDDESPCQMMVRGGGPGLSKLIVGVAAKHQVPVFELIPMGPRATEEQAD
jgi:ABC-type sulfate/molybdate transport systems ATPase subunit